MSDEVKTEGVDLADLSEGDAAAEAPTPEQAPPEPVAQDASSGAAPEEDAKPIDDDGVAAGEPSQVVSELEAVFDVPVGVAAVLGRTDIEVSKLLALNEGDVVELDRKVGEAIDIYINNRLIARGEVVLVEDRLGVTMTEIIKNDQAA